MRDTQKALDAIQEELSASEDLDTVKARIKELTAKSNQLRSEVGAWRRSACSFSQEGSPQQELGSR